MPQSALPTQQEEMQLWDKGYTFIAGIDEVGRGALAGPVVAAAGGALAAAPPAAAPAAAPAATPDAAVPAVGLAVVPAPASSQECLDGRHNVYP